jgi:hypothetical protein
MSVHIYSMGVVVDVVVVVVVVVVDVLLHGGNHQHLGCAGQGWGTLDPSEHDGHGQDGQGMAGNDVESCETQQGPKW